jgi:hypothetical protein
MGIVFLPHYQMFGLEKNCFRFFTWMTNHQIFGLKDFNNVKYAYKDDQQ